MLHVNTNTTLATDALSDPLQRLIRNVHPCISLVIVQSTTLMLATQHYPSLQLATSCKTTYILVDIGTLYECETNSNSEAWKQGVSDAAK